MPLSIFRRKDKTGKPVGSWIIRGTIGGARVYESTGTGNKKAAEILRAKREHEINQRLALGKSATLTFAEAALTYLEAGGEARFVAPLLLHFGEKTRLIDIDHEAINRAAESLYAGLEPATINRQLITPISAIYNLAVDDGHVTPRRFRRRPEPKGKTRWLTPAEADRLIGCCEPHLLPIVAFLLGSGVRTSEALGLRVENLHLDTRQALILPETSKGGSYRMVEFPERSRRLIAACRPAEAGAVFRTPKGAAYKLRTGSGGQIEAAFTKARTEARLGADVTPHTLRHTWATWFYAATRDFVRLMDLGGWTKPSTAMRYTKLAPRDLPAELEAHGWTFAGAIETSTPPAQIRAVK